MALQISQETFDAEIVAFVDPDILEDRAEMLEMDIQLRSFESNSRPLRHIPNTLVVHALKAHTPVTVGQMNIANADYVLKSIEQATQACLNEQFQAMVTGPVNKAIINQAGHEFMGHTEFIADICDQAFPVMLLANSKMRVALVSTHLPLAEVSEYLTSERLEKVITIVASELSYRFAIPHPHLLVCGLNPHAGEDGYLGDEEIETITPTLQRLRENGYLLTGPVPADTAFTPESLKDIDLVIAMYHDQGLPVLKSHGFGDTVNITLGLPIIRTSVDHGTALDLAGTGKASSSSLSSAIRQAISLAENQMMIREPASTEVD